MLRAYDMTKKGVQKFPRFFISRSATVDVEYKGQEIRTVRAATSNPALQRELLGIDVGILTDAERRIYLMDVPSRRPPLSAKATRL